MHVMPTEKINTCSRSRFFNANSIGDRPLIPLLTPPDPEALPPPNRDEAMLLRDDD
jgi:hypothetical protein